MRVVVVGVRASTGPLPADTVVLTAASHGTTFAFIVSGAVRIELMAGASTRREVRTDNILTSMEPEDLHHFCLAVEDLDAAVSHLRDKDVPLIGGPMEVPAIDQRIAFITDNLGNILELTGPSVTVS